MMEVIFCTTERIESGLIDLSDPTQLANWKKVTDFLQKSDIEPRIEKDILTAYFFETKREYLLAVNYCEENEIILK